MATQRRTAQQVAQAVERVQKLIARGLSQTAALKQTGLDGNTYRNTQKKSARMKPDRRTTEEVLQLVRQAYALVIRKGMAASAAAEQMGLADSVFWHGIKKLGLKLPPPGSQAGSISADSLPPRPRGGKRPPKVVDMNSIESLAKRMSKIDKLLHGVSDLKAERKKVAGRLRSLLKV